MKTAQFTKLRDEAAAINLDREIIGFSEFLTARLERILRMEDVDARIVHNGSTSPSRLTYVIDPRSEERAFPPTIDISVIVNGSIPEHLESAISSNLRKPNLSHEDRQRETRFYRWDEGPFNVTVYLCPAGVAAPLLKHDELAEFCSERHRLDARALRLLVGRLGASKDYNHGIPGQLADRLVLETGSFEESVVCLLRAANDPSYRRETFNDINPAHLSISRYVWRRLGKLADHEPGQEPFTVQNWESDLASGRTGGAYEIACAPNTCGRDGSYLASVTRDIIFTALNIQNKVHGMDWHVIPCQGKMGEKGHTRIYYSAPIKDIDPERFTSYVTDRLSLERKKIHS
ncbi:MAG: hypothetical protein V1735_06110 [Nanoarchaeota archaeon]